jgi:hypothetical protein
MLLIYPSVLFISISDGGKYSCLYSTTIGTNTYLGAWNQDTTVDGTDTFRFSCFVCLFYLIAHVI